MADRHAVVINAEPQAQEAMDEVNAQVLADLPTGQWEFTNVGGGIHAENPDPFKNWANLIVHPTVSGRFAIPCKGPDAKDESNRGLRAFMNAWDRLPQQARDAVNGRFSGDSPDENDVITEILGEDWFPDVE